MTEPRDPGGNNHEFHWYCCADCGGKLYRHINGDWEDERRSRPRRYDE